MKKIKIALIGIGNCASALIQGLYFYRQNPENLKNGLMRWDLGGYCPSDIVVAAAFDIDRRKIGRDVSTAIFQPPNCTTIFYPEVPPTGVTVQMGTRLDGVPEHMKDIDTQYCFDPSQQPDATRESVVGALKASGAEIMINFLPVGSQQATEFYMNCALEAGIAVVNCIPVFIASNPQWERRFRDRRLPLIGDDVKSQLGATIVHRVLTDLFRQRGVALERTYQLTPAGTRISSRCLTEADFPQKKSPRPRLFRL